MVYIIFFLPLKVPNDNKNPPLFLLIFKKSLKTVGGYLGGEGGAKNAKYIPMVPLPYGAIFPVPICRKTHKTTKYSNL